MRVQGKWLCRAAASLLCVFAGASQVSAQGFFQQLFGFNTPPMSAPPASRPPVPLTPGGRPYTFPSQSYAPRRSGDDDEDRTAKVGTLKTVCVRMCDGYYFPVSNATSKKGLFRDQMKCRTACGDEARLFHLPAGSADVGEATDGQGRTYGLLNVAYKYRKGLVAGCQCRPAPWSEAEAARHQHYAAVEVEKSATEKQQASKVVVAEVGPVKAGEPKAEGSRSDATTTQVDVTAAAGRIPQRATKLAAHAKTNSSKAIATSNAQAQVRYRSPQLSQGSKPTPTGVMSLGGGGLKWPGDPSKR